jgi:hypothetical protein
MSVGNAYRMSIKIATSVFLAILCARTTTYVHAEVSCPLDSLSTISLPGPLPASFDEFKFTIGPDGSTGRDTSTAAVRITNRNHRPINALFMVVDFYSSDQYVLSMTFYLATSAEAASFKPAVPQTSHSISPSPLSSSLLPDQSYRDWEFSSFRPAGCPDEARLTVLQVVFADGKVFDRRAAGWRTDPVLVSIEPWTLKGFPIQPISFPGRMSINERGRAQFVAISTIDSSEQSAIQNWLTDKISNTFKYAPALYDGDPISSEVNIYVRLYPLSGVDPFASIPRSWTTPAFTLLDVVSPKPGKAYELIYGGYPFVGEGFRQPKPR